MWKEPLRMLDQSLHPSVFSQEKIKLRDRGVDKMGSEGRSKTIREGGSSLEMKLSPQVCQYETISGRVFSLSYK